MLFLLPLVACSSSTATPISGVTSIVVGVDKGTVALTGNKYAMGKYTWEAWGDTNSSKLDGRVLKLLSGCASLIPCSVLLKVDVPSNAIVDVSVKDGVVQANDLTTNLVVDIGRGDFIGRDLAIPELKMTAEWTNVKLHYKKVPTSIKIDVVVGDVTIEAPPAHYNFDVDPEAKAALASYENAPGGIPVSVHSSSGQLRFKIIGDGDGVNAPGSFGM